MKFSSVVALALAAMVGAAVVCGAAPQCDRQIFKGSQVLRLSVTTEEQLQTVMELSETLPFFDLWTPSPRLGEVDIRVPARADPQYRLIMSRIEQAKIPYTVFITDVQEAIERSMKPAGNSFFEKYPTFEEFEEFRQSLLAEFPDLTSSFSMGQSLEGREMNGIKVTGPSGSGKAVIFNIGLVHAREWITGVTVAYLADQLLRQYGVNDEITSLVDAFEWQFVFVGNPDGYVYSHECDRMWRKNRSDNDGAMCKGVDLNRNWPTGWSGPGSSALPCSDAYYGPSAASEPETKNYLNHVASENVIVVNDFHSYGDMLLFPYGYKAERPDQFDLLDTASNVTVEAITGVHGTRYRFGTIYEVIYQASGGSVDTFYDDMGIIFSYAYELRGSPGGFLLPANQIIPTGEEILAGVVAFGKFIL